MKEIKIHQEKIEGSEDSFFYEGEIASFEKENGTTLSLITCGDIKIDIGSSTYKNGQILEAIEEHNLTDKKLKELEDEGKLEWLNNNWFEVTHLRKGSKYMECDIGNVEHTYDGAIQLLKDYIEDENY